jgi:hypothetical protein
MGELIYRWISLAVGDLSVEALLATSLSTSSVMLAAESCVSTMESPVA